jgi:hypothetical protein
MSPIVHRAAANGPFGSVRRSNYFSAQPVELSVQLTEVLHAHVDRTFDFRVGRSLSANTTTAAERQVAPGRATARRGD